MKLPSTATIALTMLNVRAYGPDSYSLGPSLPVPMTDA